MSTSNRYKPDEQFVQNTMGASLRIGVLLVIVYYSLQILAPFVHVVLWAMVLGVALYPVHLKLAALLGDRGKWSALIIVVVALFVLLFPVTVMTDSAVTSAKSLGGQLQAGELTIPPPRDSVAEWPIVGNTIYEIWSGAASNLEKTVNQFEPQLRDAGAWLLRAIGGVAGGVLMFVFAIMLAGFFMATAERGYVVSRKLMTLLLGEDRGDEMTDLSVSTIRSVAKGVLGVAIIQTLLAAVALIVADVPYAGIILAIFLLVAVMQIPTLIVALPIIIWMFSTSEPMGATIFAVYMVLVSMSDNVLKPLLLGRGVKIPAVVILLGAIGGAIYAGVIGLFLGAVVLAVAYELLLALTDGATADEEPATAEQ